MTLDDLKDAFRNYADDTEEPYLWSDDEIELYLNEAEAEAATRGKLLPGVGGTVGTITVTAPTALYTLNSSIIEVTRATFDSKPLKRTDKIKLDSENEDWELDTGTPTHYIITGQTIQLYPSPEASGTVSLDYYRIPVPMTDAGPEIHPRHHIKLLDWALYLAYNKRDADTYSQSTAEIYRNRFDLFFDTPQSANVQRQHLSQPVKNRPGWF